MKSAFYKLFILIALTFNLWRCSQPLKEETKKTDYPEFTDSISANSKQGIMGVYNIPTLLIIAIQDSAAMPNVAKKVANCYRSISDDLKNTGAEVNGAFGQIIYTNDSANFKFSCFAPIKSVPDKDPVNCKFATLNSANMLVYNYYGSYQNLYLGYDEMRTYMKAQNLEQIGELREFYITDPVAETDSKNWLTRIMVPIASIKEGK
jgi:effector-binding domain-containing protein